MHKEFVERGPPSRAQLLFVLSWFHAGNGCAPLNFGGFRVPSFRVRPPSVRPR